MGNSNANKAKKSTVISLFSEVIILILGFIVPRLFILNYGSEINGLVHSTAQILSYLVVFEAGIGAVMTKALYQPLANSNRDEISVVYQTGRKYYWSIVPWYILAVVAVSIVYCFAVPCSLSKLEVFAVVLFSGLGSAMSWGFVSSKSCLIQADGNYYFVAIIRLVITCLTYAAQIIAIAFNASIVWVKFLGLFVTLTQIIIYELYFRKKYNWINKNAPVKMDLFDDRKYYFFHQIATLLFSCTDTTLLTFVCSLAAVSVYTTYNMIITGINSILMMLVNSVIFILGQTYRKNIEEYKQVHDGFKMGYMILAFSFATTAYILYCPFMSIYMAGADINYVDKILALLFSLICMVNSTRMVDNNLASFAGYAKQTTHYVFIELGINIVLSVGLVFAFDIYGVLIGTLVAIIFRYFVSPAYSEKYILHRSIWKGYSFSIVNWIGFLLIFLLERVLVIKPTGYVMFFAIAVVTVILCLAFYTLLNFVFFRKNFKQFLHMVLVRTSKSSKNVK